MSMPVSLSFYYHFLVQKMRSAVVHFHEPFPLASLVGFFPKGRARYVVTWHSDIVRQRLIGKLVSMAQRVLCAKSDVVTTTSPILRETSAVLRSLGRKAEILPLSIRISDFSVEGNRPPDMPPVMNYALYVGRLSYYKGIDVLLAAHALRPGCVLVVYGEGELADVATRYVQRNAASGLFFRERHVTQQEKIWLLKNCRVLVLPSVAPSEAFGIIQLEAMACSKPVINTSLPTGVPWVSVDGETGITVSPGICRGARGGT